MIRAAQVCPDPSVRPGLQDQKDLRVRVDRKVVLVPLASRVLSAQQESGVFLACLVHLVLLDAKENGATA